MKETFKPIEGRPGYFVSDLGRVMSLKRREPVLLSIRQSGAGYAEVEVFSHKKATFIKIAREVLAAFVGYPADPWLCVAYHLNGDLMDCRLCNLAWVVCETDDNYDPATSKRRGVLKPEHTKAKMTEAKLKQSRETIEKAVLTRKNTVEMRRLYRAVNRPKPITGEEQEEIHDIYIVRNKFKDGE